MDEFEYRANFGDKQQSHLYNDNRDINYKNMNMNNNNNFRTRRASLKNYAAPTPPPMAKFNRNDAFNSRIGLKNQTHANPVEEIKSYVRNYSNSQVRF